MAKEKIEIMVYSSTKTAYNQALLASLANPLKIFGVLYMSRTKEGKFKTYTATLRNGYPAESMWGWPDAYNPVNYGDIKVLFCGKKIKDFYDVIVLKDKGAGI
jgi:hypothetical protein